MVRIKAVADKSGVSLITVSRLLNHAKALLINEDTKKRIYQVVEELGYKKKVSNTKGGF